MNKHSHLLGLVVGAVALRLVLGQAPQTGAQGPLPQAVLGTGFTYQGQLNKSGVPVTDTCSFTFNLWDSPSNATGQVGASQTVNSVAVAKGLFTVVLNGGNPFGASAFTGQARWLQTAVKCTGDSSPVTLSRQQLTAAPYAQFASAPWVTSGNNLYYNNGNVGIGTVNPTSKLEIAAQDGLAITGYQPYITLRDTNSAKRSIIAGGNGEFGFYPNSFIGGSPAIIVKDDGKVGIGAATPTDQLTVQTPPENYGLVHTDGTAVVGTWVGAGGTGVESGWIGTKTNHPLRFFTANGGPAMSIDTNGDVAIGQEPAQGFARLRVKNRVPHDDIINATNTAGIYVFAVSDHEGVWVKFYDPPTTSHVCDNGGWLTTCASAAEYVPSVNSSSGFPETADLVSIAPAVANPYGDTHAPFAVEKAATPCDPNLLGFIVNPKLGADGQKKNDHYLPLAIYGYFPAKVSLENGAIKRGDPLTSSSKAGYAMKATSACKIIGYALEDAEKEGTIQVFAQHSETAAPEVAALRAQVDDLKKQNDALAARLDTIERGQAPLQSGLLPNGALLWGALAVVGVLVARRWQR